VEKKLLCHVSQFWTIINNNNERWKSIFRKNKFYVKKTSWCHMSNYIKWMTINDIIMTTWAQL
jgi:hypothetical protein